MSAEAKHLETKSDAKREAKAIARLREAAGHVFSRPSVDKADLRALLDAHAALEARVVEFKRLQQVWLMSPEAAKRLDGYRELAEKRAALEAAHAEALDALVGALRVLRESDAADVWEEETDAVRAVLAKAGRRE